MNMDGLAKDIASAAISQIAVGDCKGVLDFLEEAYGEAYARYFIKKYEYAINVAAEEIIRQSDLIAKAALLHVPHLYCQNCNQIYGPGPHCQNCGNDEFHTA